MNKQIWKEAKVKLKESTDSKITYSLSKRYEDVRIAMEKLLEADEGSENDNSKIIKKASDVMRKTASQLEQLKNKIKYWYINKIIK